MEDYISKPRKMDPDIFSLDERIRGQINKGAFLTLYAIDRDVLIYALSIRYRDASMEEIAKVVDDILKETFITESEFKIFYQTLKERITKLVKKIDPKQFDGTWD